MQCVQTAGEVHLEHGDVHSFYMHKVSSEKYPGLQVHTVSIRLMPVYPHYKQLSNESQVSQGYSHLLQYGICMKHSFNF